MKAVWRRAAAELPGACRSEGTKEKKQNERRSPEGGWILLEKNGRDLCPVTGRESAEFIDICIQGSNTRSLEPEGFTRKRS